MKLIPFLFTKIAFLRYNQVLNKFFSKKRVFGLGIHLISPVYYIKI